MMPMSQLRQLFRETVMQRIPVIEDALAAQRDGSRVDADDTLRRIARQLRGPGTSHGFPEVTEAATLVEAAPAGELAGRAAVLLDVLRGIATSVPAVSRTILLVDDDPLITTLLSHALAGPDRAIATATTWADAQKQLETLRPALIVLDLMLPDADGRNALIWLREQPGTATVPIFILSSGAGGAVPVAECMALGATRYLEKPVKPQEVAAAVRDALLQRVNVAHWRTDERTGLLTRAGLVELFNQARGAGAPAVAAIGASSGEPIPTSVAMSLAEHAGGAMLAIWDANTIGALITEGDAAATLTAMLHATRNATSASLVAGVATEGGDSLDDAMSRAVHRQTLARGSAAGAVVSTEDAAAAPAAVLLAEDDPVVSMLVADRLKRAGMEVVHCVDGRQALELARTRAFSCAILDVKLPALDGFAVLAELRKEARHLPVAMLTSMGQEKDVMRGFQLGADDYIVKPFSPRELAARVQRLIDRSTIAQRAKAGA